MQGSFIIVLNVLLQVDYSGCKGHNKSVQCDSKHFLVSMVVEVEQNKGCKRLAPDHRGQINFLSRGQFHQHFTSSFYARIYKKRKKWQSSHQCLFALLGSVCAKVAHITLMKSTPDKGMPSSSA
jgi:hypothetical protein